MASRNRVINSLIFTRSCFILSRCRSVTVSSNAAIFFAERFEINRDAERRARFVLAPITPADRTGFIVENIHVRPQQRLQSRALSPPALLVLQQREHAAP